MRTGPTSAACDLVVAASHPDPSAGGPCLTCAFRPDTEAHRSEYTWTLARLCVEGGRPFHCHEQPQLCRGFIAAINVRGVPQTEEERRWSEMAGCAADLLGDCIQAAAEP
jgi:hypothetical protein